MRLLSLPVRILALSATLILATTARPCQAQLYGDGSDGDFTVAGTVHLAGNMNYNNLTVPPGTVLETHGFDVRVNGTLVNGGTITDGFSGGTGGNGGFGGNGGTTGPGQPGGSGASGSAGPPGTGAGGNGGAGGGGGGGAEDSNDGITATGGKGGNGASGGRGGGLVRVYAREIVNTGSINADGLAPTAGAQSGGAGVLRNYTEALIINRDLASGGGGGGGGGNGGSGGTAEVVFAIPTFVGSVTAAGGSGSPGGSGGSGRNTQYNAGGQTAEFSGGGGGGFDANGGTGGRGEVDAAGSSSGGSGQFGFAGAPGSVTVQQSALCYLDADGDGYGEAGDPGIDVVGPCPPGYADNDLDCDDGDAGVNPGAVEICNGIDDDCNGSIDDGVVFQTWYLDSDGDGYGASGTDSLDCAQPFGYVDNDLDCDDADAGVNPGAVEICNGIDDDCNGSIDDGVVFQTWYLDSDGDDYGASGTDSLDCAQPSGYADNDLDCDDGDAGVNPAAAEVCGNGIDDNCDGTIDEGCCPITVTGDLNNSGNITSADIIEMVNYIFKGGAAPSPCEAVADVNCDGAATSADIIKLVNFVFKGGDPPCDVCTLIPGTWSCP